MSLFVPKLCQCKFFGQNRIHNPECEAHSLAATPAKMEVTYNQEAYRVEIVNHLDKPLGGEGEAAGYEFHAENMRDVRLRAFRKVQELRHRLNMQLPYSMEKWDNTKGDY